MSGRQHEDSSPAQDDHRSRHMQHRDSRNGRNRDDRYQTSSSRDRYRRSPSPRQRYPSHDRFRSSRDTNGRDRSYSGPRGPAVSSTRDDPRHHSDTRRGRSPSPRNYRRAYQDRDRQPYRSPDYHDRSRSRGRTPTGPRRDRSPLGGGYPSKEIIMEGIPLDLSEADVRHHLPTYTTLHL
ncbi:MAG: hypothetical protein Q9206_005396 [Seirophora lacunosa]